MTRKISLWIIAVTAATSLVSGTAASAQCELVAPFNRVLQARDPDAAKSIEETIAKHPACGQFTFDVRRRRVLLQVTIADELIGTPGAQRRREELLVDAEEPGLFWGASMALGELRMSQRRFADAGQAFERAIEIVKNTTNTPKPPPAATVRELVDRAAQARLLAANEEASPQTATYVKVAKDHRDGGIGGSLSEDVRGFRPKSVPIPVNFETGTASPTTIGRQALEELATAISQQRPELVVIVGHTDERGGADMNMRLSEQRARTVADYVRRNAGAAGVKIVAKGKTEPLRIRNPAGLTQQDIWALNRRVEWQRAGEE